MKEEICHNDIACVGVVAENPKDGVVLFSIIFHEHKNDGQSKETDLVENDEEETH